MSITPSTCANCFEIGCIIKINFSLKFDSYLRIQVYGFKSPWQTSVSVYLNVLNLYFKMPKRDIVLNDYLLLKMLERYQWTCSNSECPRVSARFVAFHPRTCCFLSTRILDYLDCNEIKMQRKHVRNQKRIRGS